MSSFDFLVAIVGVGLRDAQTGEASDEAARGRAKGSSLQHQGEDAPREHLAKSRDERGDGGAKNSANDRATGKPFLRSSRGAVSNEVE